MAKIFTLGPRPAEEEPAQLGRTPDFETVNRLEVDCYQAALIARYGPPPMGIGQQKAWPANQIAAGPPRAPEQRQLFPGY